MTNGNVLAQYFWKRRTKKKEFITILKYHFVKIKK